MNEMENYKQLTEDLATGKNLLLMKLSVRNMD